MSTDSLEKLEDMEKKIRKFQSLQLWNPIVAQWESILEVQDGKFSGPEDAALFFMNPECAVIWCPTAKKAF